MQAPRVSVIVPTYNRAGSLARALRSVLAQTCADFELIVVDDGSTDRTAQVIAALQDSRLRYLPQSARRGAAVARSIGIDAARGEWLAFQDSDDEWTTGKLQAQLEAAERHREQPALICSWYLMLRADRPSEPELIGRAAWPRGDWSPQDCYRFPFITPTWLLRRETLQACGGFDVSLPNLEDWELAFRLIRAGTRVLVIEEPLVVKHSVGDGLFRNLPARLSALESIFDRHRELWLRDQRVTARFLGEIGRLHCASGDFSRGRDALMRALRTTPNARTALHWLASCAGERAYRRGRALVTDLRHRRA